MWFSKSFPTYFPARRLASAAERVLAFLDVLFGLPPVVVEGQHRLVGQAAIGGDEADVGEQFARMELDLGDH